MPIHARRSFTAYALAATLLILPSVAWSEDAPAAPALGEMKELEPQLDLNLTPETPAQAPAASEPAEAADPTAVSSQEPIKARAVVVDINSNDFRYDEERDVYTAVGAVHVVISEQNSELFADKVIYDQNQELMIAEGRVVIVKNGQKTEGSYAKIDLTRESALINDVATKVESLRVKAKDAMVNNKYLEFENGRLIIPQAMLAGMSGAFGGGANKTRGGAVNQQQQRTHFNSQDAAQQSLAFQSQLIPTTSKAEAVTLENNAQAEEPLGKMRFKVKEIEIHRWEDGYNKVDLNGPSLKAGNLTLLKLPQLQFSYDQRNGSTQYLGPDMGFDPDYGGLMYGPGWDFRVGDTGNFRFSPIVSYGGGFRRAANRSRYEDKGIGAGVGFAGHYRDPKTLLDFGYNTRVGQPVGYLERQLTGDGRTRLMASVNEDYRNGFLEFERPGYSVAVTDTRNLAQYGKFRLDSYESLGFYKDEFFPLNTNEFFVQPKDGATPGTAGRLQLQARIQNTEPLWLIGNPNGTNLSFGVMADMSLAGYTSGDVYALARGGPRMNVRLGNRFQSQLQYFLAATGGETPFIFDSYYRGRQNLQMQNAFKVNDYLTLGLNNGISLERDNSQGSLFTDNQVFMMVGPKTVKLNLAFDVIRRRTSFGVNFFPGNGDAKAVDFDRLKIFQPQQYGGAALTP